MLEFGINLEFTDAQSRLASLDMRSGTVKLAHLDSPRISMETLCEESVKYLHSLSDPILLRIREILLLLKKSHIHDGHSNVNYPPGGFKTGWQVGSDILLNYDYFMNPDFFNSYVPPNPAILKAKAHTEEIRSAMQVVCTSTLFHELGHLMSDCSSHEVRLREDFNLNLFTPNESLLQELRDIQYVSAFNTNVSLTGAAVANHVGTCLQYQHIKGTGTAETVSVAVELFIFFLLLKLPEAGNPFAEIIKDVAEKLNMILETLYPLKR